MHSAVSVTSTPDNARWLVHFSWGLHIVTAEKGKMAEISYANARLLVNFFWGFILWTQGTCCHVWLWYKIERTPKHSAVWFILGGYAPSFKSDSLVFRCSFYYLINKCNVIGKRHRFIVFPRICPWYIRNNNIARTIYHRGSSDIWQNVK
jgi:hypothetical protein